MFLDGLIKLARSQFVTRPHKWHLRGNVSGHECEQYDLPETVTHRMTDEEVADATASSAS